MHLYVTEFEHADVIFGSLLTPVSLQLRFRDLQLQHSCWQLFCLSMIRQACDMPPGDVL